MCPDLAAQQPPLLQDTKWMVQLAELRSELSLPALQLWSHRMRGYGVPRTQRVCEIMDTVVMIKLKEKGQLQGANKLSFERLKTLLHDVFLDISQNPRQKCYSNSSGITHCLATSTQLYSFGADRMILPFELLMFQGHSRAIRIPPNMRSNQLSHLAGEGMALPCLATVIWCGYVLKGLP